MKFTATAIYCVALIAGIVNAYPASNLSTTKKNNMDRTPPKIRTIAETTAAVHTFPVAIQTTLYERLAKMENKQCNSTTTNTQAFKAAVGAVTTAGSTCTLDDWELTKSHPEHGKDGAHGPKGNGTDHHPPMNSGTLLPPPKGNGTDHQLMGKDSHGPPDFNINVCTSEGFNQRVGFMIGRDADSCEGKK